MQSHISCMWAIFWNVILHMSSQIACLNTHISCMCALFPNVILHMSLSSQFACLNRGKVTQVACAIFWNVSVHMSLQIACLNICAIFLNYDFQIACLNRCKVTLVACERFSEMFVWNVSSHRLLEKMQSHISCIFVISSIVCFHMCSQIACLNRCKVAIVACVQNFSIEISNRLL